MIDVQDIFAQTKNALESRMLEIESEQSSSEIKIKTLETAIAEDDISEFSKEGINSNFDFVMPISKGKKYKLTFDSITPNADFKSARVFLFRADNTYVTLKNNGSNAWYVGTSVEFIATEDFEKFRIYPITTNDSVISGTVVVLFGEIFTESIPKRITSVEKNIPIIKNMLVIGDSYSQMHLWIDELSKLIPIGKLVNLGVSSATLKDKYADRETYPYNDRPVSNDTRGGNVNTFASQIFKLKRLMDGTDLDVGEVKLYENESDYPNVIIIEGGKNDSVDSDTKVANYQNQFITLFENVYVKERETDENSTATVRNYWGIPSIETVDRTSFAGAMRYLYEELHKMFPKAFIFFVTPSGLAYGTSNKMYEYKTVSKQMSECAEWLGQPVIDWAKNGRLNYIDRTIIGDGTISNPYVNRNKGQYTDDSLHPNSNGAKLIALSVASELSRWMPYINLLN